MNDKQVRERLIQYLTGQGYRPLQEVSLAYNRTSIDVVGMRDGVLCGFEIKSQADTLELLNLQAGRYRRYFEKLYLVGAESHLEGARQVLPRYWGIWAVRPSASGVHIVRKTPPAQSARANRHQKGAPLAALMRKTELVDVLQPIEPGRRFAELTRTQLALLCAELLDIREIERSVFEALHARARAPLTREEARSSGTTS